MKNVLIVEDDPMVALINKRYLEKVDGVNVLGIVMTEEEIIEYLDRDEVDLILLDIYLPKKNGIDILKSLRNKNYLVDIIMITAGNSVEEVKTAFAYGVVDYLVKPFDLERFEEAIKRYISKNKILKNTENLKQRELDKLRNIDKNNEKSELPKGLNDRTLKKVKELLSINRHRVWTVREISNELNISNVTIKKYMDFLEQTGKVRVDSTSGNVGRPELLYEINEEL